jgi:hypothetical protein
MRYCYNCNRITHGEPLFCQYCARSYDVKLCPRLHKNPRSAQACSQCGSRDLSTPSPKAPLWIAIVVFLLSLVPAALLFLASFLFVIGLIHQLFTSPRMLVSFIFLALPFTVLWAMWVRLPMALRRVIRKHLLEREKGGRS